MLIVVKLPTKADKRNMKRACQVMLSLRWAERIEEQISKPTGSQLSCSAGPKPGAHGGRCPFKNIYNEGLASGGCQDALANTPVTSLTHPLRLPLNVPDFSSLPLPLSLSLTTEEPRPDLKVDMQPLIKFAYIIEQEHTHCRRKRIEWLNKRNTVGRHASKMFNTRALLHLHGSGKQGREGVKICYFWKGCVLRFTLTLFLLQFHEGFERCM